GHQFELSTGRSLWQGLTSYQEWTGLADCHKEKLIVQKTCKEPLVILTNHSSAEVEKLEPLNPPLHGYQTGMFACLLVLSEHIVPNGCHKHAMFGTVQKLVSSRESKYPVGNPA